MVLLVRRVRRPALQAAPGRKARLFARHEQSPGLFVSGLSPQGDAGRLGSGPALGLRGLVG